METIKRYYLIFITLNSLLDLFILRFSLLKQISNYRTQGKVIFLHLFVYSLGGMEPPLDRDHPPPIEHGTRQKVALYTTPIAGADI